VIERPFINAGATRASLTDLIENAPVYFQPILKVVRDHGVAMLFVPQGLQPFRIPDQPQKPAIILVGDDLEVALSPDGFHRPSIRRAIRACNSFAVISSAPQSDVYATVAVGVAATRHHAMLIETRPEQELAWVALIQTLAPGRFIQLATVEGGHA
jgi:hypothetical protein